MKKILVLLVLAVMQSGIAYAGQELNAQSADGYQGAKALQVLTALQQDAGADMEKRVFSLASFHNGNFGTDGYATCGWHVEVDSNFLVLKSIRNPRFNYTNDEYSCYDHVVVLKCIGKDCTKMKNFAEELPLSEREYVRLMDDGNLIYINGHGTTFKNYRAW